MKKYELTSEYIEVFGRKLFRIKALIAFGSIEVGELGGYVETENNLSQSGNAWVYGDARVSDNAWVYGDADITKETHLITIGAIGSRNDFTTFFRSKTKEILVRCGCFRGNIKEFETAVLDEHKGTKHEKTYKIAIALAKVQIEMEG